MKTVLILASLALTRIAIAGTNDMTMPGVIPAATFTPHGKKGATAQMSPVPASAPMAPAAVPLPLVSTPTVITPSGCPPPDALFLPTGFTFPAVLPDAIYSYNVTAPVMALLEDDVKFRGRIVLPRTTRLVGNASTLHSLDRVNINWELAVLPEGCEFQISAIAISANDGSAGIQGKLEKHEDSIAAQIALKSMITAAGSAAAAVTPAAPLEGAVAGNFANEANQNVDQNIAKVKNLESITVRERTAIRVFVLRRFLRPGEGR